MVVVPVPTMVTVPPEVTVATPGVLLVYVNAPPLLLVGAVRSNDASPKFLAGALKAPMVGAMGETTSDADRRPARVIPACCLGSGDGCASRPDDSDPASGGDSCDPRRTASIRYCATTVTAGRGEVKRGIPEVLGRRRQGANGGIRASHS